MNFYVPDMTASQADIAWLYARGFLLDRGRPTTGRRIRALVWHDEEGEEHYLMVGGDTPFGEDDLVMVILQAGDVARKFYVCTADQLADRADPYPLTLDERWRVVEFDA